MSPRAAGLVASVALACAACGSILGVEAITVVEEVRDASVPEAADGPAAPLPACALPSDCPTLETEPAGCAIAACEARACVYRAVDGDHDGHPAARCAARDGTPVERGDDCDDANEDLFAGREIACAEDATGAPIVFPRGEPVGTCRRGTRACNADGTVSGCRGAVGPAQEQCDALDHDCNGAPGIDEGAAPAPLGTLICASLYRCPAPGRGAIYYRDGGGFTNVAGGAAQWTGYAPQGDFSSGMYPPNTYRIARGDTATKLGTVSIASPCCPTGCPTANTLFDGSGQYFSPPYVAGP